MCHGWASLHPIPPRYCSQRYTYYSYINLLLQNGFLSGSICNSFCPQGLWPVSFNLLSSVCHTFRLTKICMIPETLYLVAGICLLKWSMTEKSQQRPWRINPGDMAQGPHIQRFSCRRSWDQRNGWSLRGAGLSLTEGPTRLREKVTAVLEEGPHFILEINQIWGKRGQNSIWYVPFNYQGFSQGSMSLGLDCVHFIWLLNDTLLLVHWGWELKPVPSRYNQNSINWWLKQQTLFLKILKTGKSKIKEPADLVSSENWLHRCLLVELSTVSYNGTVTHDYGTY